jgi:stage II sporulation protein P
MNRLTAYLALLIFVLALAMPVQASERSDGGYYIIVDEAGQPVFHTGWRIRVGDQCLTADNRRYEVVDVRGDTGYGKFIGTVDLAAYAPAPSMLPALAGRMLLGVAQAQGNMVAIYHTHSDESYVPTDGKESIPGNGGVYKVGKSFADSLQAKGMAAVQSTAKHDPHDDMAYERSRRTALDLVKQQPAAIFDVHRDAVPPEVYKTNINGQDVSKVQLVVGKYGPTGKQIEDYALKVKAASDQQHPGLVKGIFFAKGGDYNQDLHPRSLLLEVGAHTNDRPSAERGIALFADVVPTVLGGTSGNPGNPGGVAGFGTTGAGASGATKSMGWLIGILIVGAAGFLLLATGSFKEAGAKLKQFRTTEFANFFAPRAKRKQRPDDKDKEDNG